jgi:hypothetical protein
MVRTKIQASQIINRLKKHVDGEVELTSTQVRAAEILLNKSLPNLQSTEVQATVENVTNPAELSDAELANIAAGSGSGATEQAYSEEQSTSVH